MTEEKICPIMSRPFVAIAANQLPYSVDISFKNDLCYTACLKENCMAWIPECNLVDPKYKDAPGDCMDQIPGKRCKKQYRIDCQGYCKLIEGGS